MHGRIGVAYLMLGMLMPLAGAVGSPADECSAEVTATLEDEADPDLQFDVEVTTEEDCAEVLYDLVIEERLPNGQANLVRKARTVTVTEGTLTEVVEHTLPEGHALLGFEAKVVKCTRCEEETDDVASPGRRAVDPAG